MAIIPNSATDQSTNRDASTMVYDVSRTQLFLFGGKNNTAAMNDSWAQVNAGSWAQKSPANSPSSRYFHAMAYYPTDGYTYAHGGTDGIHLLSDMYKWDGLTWTKLSPAGTLPTQRYAHEIVADGSGNIILFGGIGTTLINREEYLQDTFKYASGTWTQITSTNIPPARAGHCMVYNGSNVIIFGGEQNGQYLNDMWSLNSGTGQWSLVVQGSTLPMARKNAMMIWDSHNSQILLMGGVCIDGHISNETWAFKSGAWSLLSTPTHFTRRYNAAVAFDSGTNVVSMFGGRGDATGSQNGFLGDLWLYDAVAGTWSGTGAFEAAQSTGPVF